MSGFGERFREAGYQVPKPLIEVDGKPIIEHIVEMFPGEKGFVFICNEDHLNEPAYGMRKTLNRICPTGQIIVIAPHKLGPVHAVLTAMEKMEIATDEPAVVNYCDFTCYWDWASFKQQMIESGCDGSIPCYRGFHPHTIWSNYYAYVRERDLQAFDIQEKQPFTDNPRQEFASSGTYYFKTAALMQQYFHTCIDRKLMVGNEYYVSMVYKPMMEDGCDIRVYDLEHFMQWGVPLDLKEYQYWSNAFQAMLHEGDAPAHTGALLLPMAGMGSRFVQEGYTTPKPLIPVSGKPMVLQALDDLPQTDRQRLIMRSDLADRDALEVALIAQYPQAEISLLDKMTDGQAATCILGADGLDSDQPVTIAACDNGMIYSTEAFEGMLGDQTVDIIVWGARGYPGAIRQPEMYGWIAADKDGTIERVSVKQPLDDVKRDPIVVGTFTFRCYGDFVRCYEHMMARQGLVNGEYYVDTTINDALELGLNCRLFEIDYYLCWGTPRDLWTFNYWQTCLHKWHSHPYRTENDPNTD